jgi:hypothetical protein
MRKLTLFLLAWLCLAMSRISAQSSSLESSILDMVSPLDMTPVTQSTGIFIDRVPQYVAIRRYGGLAVTDSTHVDVGTFKLAYAMIDHSHLGSSSMYSEDSITAYLDRYKTAPVVHLGLMAYQYDGFRRDAIATNLLTYDGQKLHNVPNAPTSPFVRDTMMMTTLYNPTYQSLDVPYTLPSDFLSTNFSSIQQLSFDFGDGLGFRSLVADRIYDIHYPAAGIYTIIGRMTLSGGSQRISSTRIKIIDASTSNL